MGGRFTISLDFELHWGVRDVVDVAGYRENLLGVRRAIPALLQLFRSRDIHATWATVGFLFCESRRELLESLPGRRPRYRYARLSPYSALASVGEDERSDPFHFAPSLIEQVLRTPHQEVGTHTFSHYYCLEDEGDGAAFAADLEAAGDTARRKFGIELRSIVFPRNQVRADYLPICARAGLLAYRGAQSGWFNAPVAYTNETWARRAARLLDAYVPLAAESSVADDGPVRNVAATVFLRPTRRATRALDPLRLRRIRRALRRAAEQDGVFHLWWHPHNFGTNLEANMHLLGEILDEVDVLRRSHGMRSVTMLEAATDP